MTTIDTTDWKWATAIIGIELEFPTPGDYASDYLCDQGMDVDFVDYNHDTYGRIVIKHDGSCGVDGGPGCELVSPPTVLADLVNDQGAARTLRQAWGWLSENYLSNPKYGSRCGIHIHVGVESDRDPSSNLIRLRLDRLWRAYSARSAPVMDFCGDGRDPAKSGHARRYCGAHLALSDKYGQVNASPLMSGRQNTVEFRQLGMTRATTEVGVEPFAPEPVPEDVNDLLRWTGYSVRSINNMDPIDRRYHIEGARQQWLSIQDEERARYERGQQVHTQLEWGDIVEWAIFVTLLTEGVCHSSGWIAKQRNLIGDTRPDGKPWSDFWSRPNVPYEEPGVDPVDQRSRLTPVQPAAPTAVSDWEYRASWGSVLEDDDEEVMEDEPFPSEPLWVTLGGTLPTLTSDMLREAVFGTANVDRDGNFRLAAD